jgi:hypothetical protein
LDPLVKFIDFKLIRIQILADFIEPLGIIPSELILNVYRYKALFNNSDLDDIRGRSQFAWDKSACGSKLIIEDNGKVVQASKALSFKSQSVRSKMILENKGMFEWDIIIEKDCRHALVGICSSEDFNYESWVNQSAG